MTNIHIKILYSFYKHKWMYIYIFKYIMSSYLMHNARLNTNTCGFCTWPLFYLHDVFGPSVQGKNFVLMGHSYNIVL